MCLEVGGRLSLVQRNTDHFFSSETRTNVRSIGGGHEIVGNRGTG